MNTQICPTCHAPIPANAPGGFCPACLLRDAEEPASVGRAAPSLEEIAVAFPKLEILRLIGHGGMGFVYQARQPELDRMVALKILSPVLRPDPAFEERFAREARVLGKLQHPNIVTLFEHGESGGFFYLMMEYIDGVNLRQAMAAGRFTPEQALAIVPAICDALQSAHAQGVWHRDIKPENILLDRDGRVKIADFGIARILGDPERNFTLTRTGGMLGSAAYMAPEQHEKPHEVDHRADIYSLGVVIYEMLTGELPLGRFPAPSQRAAVNARIDEIVMRTLEKERELRQQSADEVKTDVKTASELGDMREDRSILRWKDSKSLPLQWIIALLAGGMFLNFSASSFGSGHETIAIVFSIIGRMGILVVFVIAAFTAYARKPSMWTAGLGLLLGLAVIVNLSIGHPRDIMILGLLLGSTVIWTTKSLNGNKSNHPQYRPKILGARRQETDKAKTEVEVAGSVQPGPGADSRFSTLAIVGACLIPVPFLIGIITASMRGLNHERELVAFVLETIAALACTILGWVAFSQIRGSAAKLRGIWLALIDGLLFPVLVLVIFLWSE